MIQRAVRETELENVARQYEDAKRTIVDLAEGLSLDELTWSPAPETWGVGDCLSHLQVVGVAALANIDAAVESAWRRGTTGSGPFRHGWLFNFVTRTMDPPVRVRVPAPRFSRPQHVSETTVTDLLTTQDRIIDAIVRADGLHLARVRVASPASKWIRMSLGQMFAFLAAHQRRHFWQARRVRDHADFPGRSTRNLASL